MKKCISLLLATLMLVSACSVSAETTKHERVFAVLGADGTPETILDQVRLENGDGLDTIIDQTILSDIENISGTEEFTLSGGTLTWKTAGNDITYRGKGEETLPATPRVIYELDGREVAAWDIAEAVGQLRLTVTYTRQTNTPVLALSCIPVPEGATEITVEHAIVLSEAGKQFVLGWGVPGAEDALALPTGFTIVCHVDHARFEQMLTVETAEPLNRLVENGEGALEDADCLIGDVTAILTSFQTDDPLPEVTGKLNELIQPLAQLTDGLSRLNEGAEKLCEGAASLENGASALNDGLNTLTSNNEALNAGAAQIFAGVLRTANQQLDAAGLSALGITIPELTPDNYASAIDVAVTQLTDTEALTTAIAQNARAQIAAAIEENDAEIRAAVAQEVRVQALETILSQLSMPMTAEDYAAAEEDKQIPEETHTQIQAALALQMEDPAIEDKIEAAVGAQKEMMIAQYLESPEIQTQMTEVLSTAQAGTETLIELKTSLDGICAFVSGVADYTSGVSEASDGASQLLMGSSSLKDGIFALEDGVSALRTGLVDGNKALAERYLPNLNGEVADILQAIHATKDAIGAQLSYDVVPENMDHDLCVIIRTEMNR